MSSENVVKTRISRDDNVLINVIALKLAARKNGPVTNKEVLNALLQHADPNGERCPDAISETLEPYITRAD